MLNRSIDYLSDLLAARLIQAHAEHMSLFVANGYVETSRNHGVPVLAR